MVVVKEDRLDAVPWLPWLVPWPSWDELKAMICSMFGCMRVHTLVLVFLDSLLHLGSRHLVTLSSSPPGSGHPILSHERAVLAVI